MVERKRDPAVGKAWLAWYALQAGDEPTDCVGEFLDEIGPRLGEFLANRSDQLAAEDRQFLSDLRLVLIALAGAAKADKGFAKKIEWKNRTAGRRGDRLKRANDEYQAVALVERLISEGHQEESAVQQAVIDTGISRAEIFARWRYVRAWRDPDARQRIVENIKAPPGCSELLEPFRQKKS